MNLDLLTPIQLRRAYSHADFGSASPSAHQRGNPPGNVSSWGSQRRGGALPMSLRVACTGVGGSRARKPQTSRNEPASREGGSDL